MAKKTTNGKKSKKDGRGRPPIRVILPLDTTPKELAKMVGSNKFYPAITPKN